MSDGSITKALNMLDSERPDSLNLVMRLSYADMLKVVRVEKRRMAGGPATLDSEGLLQESLARLIGSDRPLNFEDRRHLFRTVAKISRHILIDHCRAKSTAKRGSGVRPVEYDDDVLAGDADPQSASQLQQIIWIDQLHELETTDPDLAELLENRYFLELSETEAAEVLGVSVRTVQRRWAKVRKYLQERGLS